MSVVANQQRTLIALLAQLRPHWRQDRNLPARIQTLLSGNRSFGSRDRRLYRELVYTTLRFLPWLESILEQGPEHAARLIAWLAADSPATQNFRRTLIADWPECPASVAEKAAMMNQAPLSPCAPTAATIAFRPSDLLPPWLREECPDAYEEPQIDALHSRAPLWLRVHSAALPEVTAEFDRRGWRWRIAPVLKTALQVLGEVDVTKSETFARGLFEVQDLGSQLLLESAGILPGGRWLDACAGAGGKTLQLAQLLGPTGHIDAFDLRRAALAELATRATRARVENLTILQSLPTGSYDGVLVDAPCSGAGTWRRAPHLKWTTTAQQVAAAAEIQRKLLSEFSERVRPGGRLLYATCSINRSENEAVVSDFLGHHTAFDIDPPLADFGGLTRDGGLTLLPALHDTDGFFIAAFRRSASAQSRGPAL